jgi:hypothetical protein
MNPAVPEVTIFRTSMDAAKKNGDPRAVLPQGQTKRGHWFWKWETHWKLTSSQGGPADSMRPSDSSAKQPLIVNSAQEAGHIIS